MKKVERLDAIIDALLDERNLWQGIVARETPKIPAKDMTVQSVAPVNESSAADEYGSKTNALRRFLIGRSEGSTMKELRAEARKFTDQDNMAYRFVDRLAKAGELVKRDGRFFATPKMQTILEEKVETSA